MAQRRAEQNVDPTLEHGHQCTEHKRSTVAMKEIVLCEGLRTVCKNSKLELQHNVHNAYVHNEKIKMEVVQRVEKCRKMEVGCGCGVGVTGCTNLVVWVRRNG
jgi:hypothetical protein